MNSRGVDRRDVLKTSALAMGGALLPRSAEAYPKGVNTNSSPSTLKITDMRVATVVSPARARARSFASTPTRACTGWAKSAMAPAPPMPCS